MRTKPVLRKWMARVCFDWLVIALCFIAVYNCVWLLPVCAIIIGARQHGLALMGHDGVHYLASENKVVNDLFTGLFAFWPIHFAISGYRQFHFEHHRTVGTEDDPELIHKNHWLIGQWQYPLNKRKLAFQCLGDCFGGSLLHFPVIYYLTYPRGFGDVLGIAVVLTLMFTFLPWWVIGLWYGCLLTTFFVFFRLRIWGEHIGAEHLEGATHVIKANWWQRFFFFPHNAWCHYEHHRSASIPCWALPDARDKEAKTISELIKEITPGRVEGK